MLLSATGSLKDKSFDAVDEIEKQFGEVGIEKENEGEVIALDENDTSMRLPFTEFEFTKVIRFSDKREKFYVFIVHLLSGSASDKDGSAYSIDLIENGSSLLFKGHMKGIAKKFLDVEMFKSALQSKLLDPETMQNIFIPTDADDIAKQFDEVVRDKTDSFNSFDEWVFTHKLPTDFSGRDIVLQFPIIKLIKSNVDGLKKDTIQCLCTIVRLDWEDKESAKIKTPSKGVVLSCSDDSSEDEPDEQDNGRKRQRQYARTSFSQSTSSNMKVRIKFIHSFQYFYLF